MAHVNRKEYWAIFGFLFLLTILEVLLAYTPQWTPAIDKRLVVTGLIALAVAKAALVGLFYMHLKHETRVLKLTVAIPLATPAVYALVLISEAAWRLVR
jgi:caa(3)-type oxidase subunit IV